MSTRLEQFIQFYIDHPDLNSIQGQDLMRKEGISVNPKLCGAAYRKARGIPRALDNKQRRVLRDAREKVWAEFLRNNPDMSQTVSMQMLRSIGLPVDPRYFIPFYKSFHS